MAQRLYYRKFITLDWEKDDAQTFEKSVHHAFRSKVCTNCGGNFSTFLKPIGQYNLYDNPQLTGKPTLKTEAFWLFICYSCGWWQIAKKSYMEDCGFVHDPFIYHSVLERLDEDSDRSKTIQFRQELQKNWDARKNLSAGDAAELVRGVMKDHYKCEVEHTKAHVNTPDGGIDLLVGHDTTKVIAAVQVKRKKNNGL